VSGLLTRNGADTDALRPACAIWIPGTAPWSFRNAVMRRNAATCSSDQIPESSGLMRPSGATALASTITAPAPPVARAPRWTRCQSFGTPSIDEYWHMGETQARLRNSTSRKVMGV